MKQKKYFVGKLKYCTKNYMSYLYPRLATIFLAVLYAIPAAMDKPLIVLHEFRWIFLLMMLLFCSVSSRKRNLGFGCLGGTTSPVLRKWRRILHTEMVLSLYILDTRGTGCPLRKLRKIARFLQACPVKFLSEKELHKNKKTQKRREYTWLLCRP